MTQSDRILSQIMFNFLMSRHEVTPLGMALRLTDLWMQSSKSWEQGLREQLNREGIGEQLYQAVQNEIENIILFTIEFTVATTIPKQTAKQVLERFTFSGGPSNPRLSHYYECFHTVSDGQDSGFVTFKQAAAEYLIAGTAFLDNCGPAPNKDLNNLIRQMGCQIFSGMNGATKRFLKQFKITG